jgi:hypothetical protein
MARCVTSAKSIARASVAGLLTVVVEAVIKAARPGNGATTRHVQTAMWTSIAGLRKHNAWIAQLNPTTKHASNANAAARTTTTAHLATYAERTSTAQAAPRIARENAMVLPMAALPPMTEPAQPHARPANGVMPSFAKNAQATTIVGLPAWIAAKKTPTKPAWMASVAATTKTTAPPGKSVWKAGNALIAKQGRSKPVVAVTQAPKPAARHSPGERARTKAVANPTAPENAAVAEFRPATQTAPGVPVQPSKPPEPVTAIPAKKQMANSTA